MNRHLRIASPRKRIRLVAVLSALGVVAGACHTGTPSLIPKNPPPKVPDGRLRTEGTRIVGPNGQTVRLIGANLQGLQSSNDQGTSHPDACGRNWKVPLEDSAKDMAEWGFNSVRLTVAWANIEPTPPTRGADGSLTHHWGEEYMKVLDGVIASLQKEHIAIILDMAQHWWSSAFKQSGPSGGVITCEGWGMPAWMYPNADSMTLDQAHCDLVANRAEPGVPERPWEGLDAVWTFLAKRYGNRPWIIGADVINEPYFRPQGCTGPDFQGMYRSLGTAVRRDAPRWLLIFEYFPAANPMFGIDSPPPFDDQVYSVHVYTPSWTLAEQFLDAAWKQARQWRMPLYVGEFTAFGATLDAAAPQPDWQGQTKSMLDWMKQRGVSWSVFGFAGGASLVKGRSGEPKVDVIKALQQGY